MRTLVLALVLEAAGVRTGGGGGAQGRRTLAGHFLEGCRGAGDSSRGVCTPSGCLFSLNSDGFGCEEDSPVRALHRPSGPRR